MNESHTVVWRNNAMRIDQHDRKAERNITLGSKTTIVASGRGSATAHPNRVQVRPTLARALVLTLTPTVRLALTLSLPLAIALALALALALTLALTTWPLESCPPVPPG